MSIEQSLQIVLQEPAAAIAVLVVLTGGLLGMGIRNMVESVVADEDKPEEGEPISDGGEAGLIQKEESDDGDDGLGGLGESADLGGLDDSFDDDGLDEMGGSDDGVTAGNADELEHRLDELENEVGSLSSTVNTVRNENEQISESVQEVEENVGKLLDIYEMVTRGVNPFADEMDGGMGMGGGDMSAQDGSFGLFTDDEDGDDADESVDEDIADADAEGFFDDDLVGEEEEVEDAFQKNANSAETEDDAFGEVEEFDDGDPLAESDGTDELESSEMGLGEVEEFDELDEQETDPFEAAEETVEDVAVDEIEKGSFDDFGDDTIGSETDSSSETAEAVTEQTETEKTVDDPVSTTASSPTTASMECKPYLPVLPEGIAAELIVVEWLEYLVGELGIHETAKAIDYYETIGWLTEDVADELDTYLAAYGNGKQGTLSVEHHTKSLEYVEELTTIA